MVAGDCTGSAYIFAPKRSNHRPATVLPAVKELDFDTFHGVLEDRNESEAVIGGNSGIKSYLESHNLPEYELAFEIECGATVGSAAVTAINDGSGDVNLYIPSYELNKVLINTNISPYPFNWSFLWNRSTSFACLIKI